MQAISANTAFSLQRCSILQHDEQQLQKQWNNDAFGKHFPQLVFLNTLILRDNLIEILWFQRVNYEAMNRIRMKLARFDHIRSPELEKNLSIFRTQCEQYKRAYNECVDQLDRVQARLATYQTPHSDSRIIPYTLDQDRLVVAAILQGNNNMSTGNNDHGKTPLHFGAALGMINLCMQVLSKVSPVEKYILLKDGSDSTALHISVARGHFEVTQLLLSAMNKLPAMIPDDLLHIALRREDDAMVKLLISRFIGLKHISSSGESSLYIAAQLGQH